MKIWATIAFVVGLVGPALAQELTQADKTAALKRAYELNGNSMVRWGSIDLTNEPVVVRTIPIDNVPKVAPPPPVRLASGDKANICRRHGMRKVVTGRSWRCRR